MIVGLSSFIASGELLGRFELTLRETPAVDDGNDPAEERLDRDAEDRLDWSGIVDIGDNACNWAPRG